jgi:hypothetical protein
MNEMSEGRSSICHNAWGGVHLDLAVMLHAVLFVQRGRLRTIMAGWIIYDVLSLVWG